MTFILLYWWAFALGSIPFLYVSGKIGALKYRDYKIKVLQDEKKRIFELKKEVQKKYFKEGSLSKEVYMELMKRYEDRENEAKGELENLRASKLKK